MLSCCIAIYSPLLICLRKQLLQKELAKRFESCEAGGAVEDLGTAEVGLCDGARELETLCESGKQGQWRRGEEERGRTVGTRAVLEV